LGDAYLFRKKKKGKRKEDTRSTLIVEAWLPFDAPIGFSARKKEDGDQFVKKKKELAVHYQRRKFGLPPTRGEMGR